MRYRYMQNSLVLNLPRFFSLGAVFKRVLSFKKLLIFSAVLIISLLALYIFQVNSVVSESYQIQKYQKKITELSEENKILEINSLQLNSLVNIENKVQELGFEKADKIYYIRLLEGQVAKE